MPVPHSSENFGDLLDIRFQRIYVEKVNQLKDMISTLYADAGTNGRDNMKWSSVGALPDFSEFTGEVKYNSQAQGYDTTLTPLEFVNGVQVKRKLFDDDQYHIMDQKPRSVAISGNRTRQKHGARIFTNAFSVDTYLYNNSEGVALCSDSHTTTSGASTANGFDNKGTAPISAAAVAAARIQMVKFRGDQAERIQIMPDELWYPPDLYDKVHEIVKSKQKPGSAENDDNVHEDSYTTHEWNYMSGDANNWFMGDSISRAESLFWTDRIALEFAMVEDFDKLIAKWRGYGRWAQGWIDWRWIFGAQVT